MTVYAPGSQERDPQKQNMALQEHARQIDLANTATTTNTASIAANTASITALQGDRVGRVIKQVFTGSGTYTPTTGMLYCIIECVGGGGGGGSAAGTVGDIFVAAGGNSGGYSRLIASAATIGASQTVTIGALGAGGASGSNNGSTGGDTSVGSICIAKGGPGGKFAAVAQIPIGTAIAVAGTGDLAAAGNPGAPGFYSVITTVLLSAGSGASSIFGGGAATAAVTSGAATAGVAASAYGAGGSGANAVNVAANAAGGNGSAGVVFITEFVIA